MTVPADIPSNAVQRTTFWGSLKLRLALIGALLIALSVALTVALTLQAVNRDSEEVALSLSLAQTRKLAKVISARMADLQLAMSAAAARLDTRRPIDTEAAKAFLEERSELGTDLSVQVVATPDGHILALRDSSGVRAAAIELGDRDYFKQTVAQKRPVISQPILERGINEPAVALTIPVLDTEGHIVAVFGGTKRLATRALLPEITAGDADDPAKTVIVDASGRILSHPDPQWLMRDATTEPSLSGAMADWTRRGRPIEPAGAAANIDGDLVSSAGIPGAEWVILRSTPLTTVLGGAMQAQKQALAIGAIVALGGGGLLLAFTFAMLRPLRQLEQCADGLIGTQDYPLLAWPDANNEIGRLSRVLQRALRERAQADAAGRDLLDRLQAVMSHSPVGIAFTRNQVFEAVNDHLHHLLGYPAGSLVGQSPRSLYVSDAAYAALSTGVAAAFAAGTVFDEELETMRRDGSRFWGRIKAQPVRQGDASAGTIWTLEDATEQRQQREHLAWASNHDALTGLVNRAEFERLLGGQCNNRRRQPASALFLDLDRFKSVNDSAGHAAGDAVLVAVARTLEQLVRQGDTVARLGGDEFGVLLTACDRNGAARLAEQMRAAIDALHVAWEGATLSVGISIGVVELDASLPDVPGAMAAADAACYAAKRDGRNSVRVHGLAGLRVVGQDRLY